MGILRSDGIVLKSIPYGESSKIVTVLTRDHGKVTMLAKGARDIRSKFGGSLELFNQINMIYYEKETREIQYLSEVSIINPFCEIRNSPERMTAAMTVLEMAHRAIHGNEDTSGIYALVTRTMNLLNQTDKPIINAILYFMIQLVALLGYRIETRSCPYCPDIMAHRFHRFEVAQGRIVCEECPDVPSAGTYPISRESIGILKQLSREDGQAAANLVLSYRAREECWAILLNYLQYHVEEIRQLHTLAMIRT